VRNGPIGLSPTASATAEETRALPRWPALPGILAAILRVFACALLTMLWLPVSRSLQSQDKSPQFPQGIGSEAVWNLLPDAWPRLNQQCPSNDGQCLMSFMRANGASSDALDFTRLVRGEGFLAGLKKIGPVDLATVVFPFRANSNEELALVNGDPLFVDVTKSLEQSDFEKEPSFGAVLENHRNAGWEGDVPAFQKVEALPGGGQRFVFSFLVRDGCHACEAVAKGWLAADFGPSAKYRGLQLLGFTSPSLTAMPSPMLPGEQQAFQAQEKLVPPNLLITNDSVGPVRLGMTILQVRRVLSGFRVERTTIGDGAVAYAVRKGSKELMLLVPRSRNEQTNNDSDASLIDTIEVGDPGYATVAGVHPGMLLVDVEAIYGPLIEIFMSEVEMQESATFAKLPDGIGIGVCGEGKPAGVYAQRQNKTTQYDPSARVQSIVIFGAKRHSRRQARWRKERGKWLAAHIVGFYKDQLSADPVAREE
jgi:hypothetical protein